MGINTTKYRVPIAPYQLAYPNRPIRWVQGDHGPLVFITFKDGTTVTSVRAAEE